MGHRLSHGLSCSTFTSGKHHHKDKVMRLILPFKVIRKSNYDRLSRGLIFYRDRYNELLEWKRERLEEEGRRDRLEMLNSRIRLK